MAREYKDSGIEWIGLIPKEWKVVPLKWILRNPLQYGANENGKSFDESLPRYIRITDILNNNLREDIQKQSLTEKQAVGYILEDNDILFARSGGTVGKAFIYKSKYGRSAFAGYLIRAQINKENNPWYVYYFTQSSAYEEWKNKIFIQATIQNIGADRYSLLEIPLPPLPEQEKIADYLDKVCGEVDEMIALQEKMIEELKAYKQSIITEAVTKGLNPNVPMKNSGIDWIGEIPEHWRLEPLKYCFGRRSEKNCPVKTKERLSLSIDKGVTLYAEKTTNLDRFKDDFTQYQITYPNDIVLNCMNMIVGAVGLSNYMGCVSPVYYVIYPSKQDVSPLYYSYLLNIPTIRGVYYSLGKGIYAIERGEGRVNTCRLKVSYNDFGRLEIPVPPVKEQKAITQYIQEKCSEIDSLITIKQQKIAELKEYKKSVIYEYVTGKKEVI